MYFIEILHFSVAQKKQKNTDNNVDEKCEYKR